MRERLTLDIKRRWAAAMIDLITAPSEAKLKKALQVIGEDRRKQEVMDV